MPINHHDRETSTATGVNISEKDKTKKRAESSCNYKAPRSMLCRNCGLFSDDDFLYR